MSDDAIPAQDNRLGSSPPEAAREVRDGAVLNGFADAAPDRNGAAEALSPSLLWPTKTTASYELKFLVSPAQAQQVEAWAQAHLALDPHADAALGNAYAIRSIYFDTAQLDVYRQTRTYKRRKFRMRRYGSERGVFLERKTKSGDRVAKRRTLICDEELVRLRHPAADPDWPAFWFHRRLFLKQLQPRCVIGYERVAHVGMAVEGPIRLTLDRRIECALAESHDFQVATARIPLLTDVVILELKFRAALPVLFKGLVHEMGLNPRGVSKYRAAIDAWGLAASTRGAG